MPTNRLELAEHFASLGFCRGAEVGVMRGYYSSVLLRTIPNLNLLSVDTWGGIYSQYYALALKALSDFPGSTILAGLSVDVARLLPDRWLDFVYLDAGHDYESVALDLRAWAPKVRAGGIISGHDYYIFKHSGNDGVIRAVDEYVAANGRELNLTKPNANNQHKDNRQPSWWFHV